MKKKAFTLIELIAVLVILAILALIVTPLVMNIIKKARISADKRSIDAYGRSVELAIASYLIDTGTFPTDFKNLNVEYTGKEVVCNIMQMKENGGIYLSECTVGGKQVKDSHTEDGWYHYGTRDITDKEYVDMYGRALEKALKKYYDENNTYPEDYKLLTLDYNGKEISCEVSINSDGSVYLTNCTEEGISILDDTEDGYYHYGKLKFKSYSIGNEVMYNNINFYVIEDSDENRDTVSLLKAEPLTYEEVIKYSIDTKATVKNKNGYGVMPYYNSNTCSNWIFDGCTADYELSHIKIVLDNWKSDMLLPDDLSIDSTGYSVRLITYDELIDNLGYSYGTTQPSWIDLNPEYTPDFVYNSKYFYWTMSVVGEKNRRLWVVYPSGNLDYNVGAVYDPNNNVVRPVITLKKSALQS